MLGAPAALGRTFGPENGEAGRDNVVVLSDGLWRRRFDARADAIGATLELDGRSYVIAGVMPPTFTHPYPMAQLWTPAALSTAALDDRKQRSYRVVARLRDGVTRERAEVELRAIAERLAREHPDTHEGFSVSVRPLRDFYVGDARPLLWVLQGTAFVLLLVAVSNVAGLVLVREAGRQREAAVRLRARREPARSPPAASGRRTDARRGRRRGRAGRCRHGARRILPQLLATRLQGTALPDGMAGWIDARVLLATACATIAAGAIFGVTPLLRRADGSSGALRASGRGATGDRQTRLMRQIIVTAQIALSVLLLVGAGLLVRSFARLHDRSFGFQTSDIVTAQLLLPRDRYATTEQSAAFLDQLVTAVAALPGVESAAAVNTLPLTGFNALRPHNLPGQPVQERLAEFRIVTPAYFETMAIQVRRGRVFDGRDRSGSPGVIVVNETAARRLWPGVDRRRPDADGSGLRRVLATGGDRCRGRYPSSRSREGSRARDLPAGRAGLLAVLRPRRANALDSRGTGAIAPRRGCARRRHRPHQRRAEPRGARRHHLGVAPLEHGAPRGACRGGVCARVRGGLRGDGVRRHRAIAGDRRARGARRQTGWTSRERSWRRAPGSRAPASRSVSCSPGSPEASSAHFSSASRRSIRRHSWSSRSSRRRQVFWQRRCRP